MCRMSLSESSSTYNNNMPETTRVRSVADCPVSTLPFEYCEFDADYKAVLDSPRCLSINLTLEATDWDSPDAAPS